jgi:hypothetical protein
MPSSLRCIRLIHRAGSRAPSRLGLLPALLLVGTVPFGCSGPAGSPASSDEPAAAASTEAAAAEGDVEYQPAFPAEVSDAPLEASDVAQQEAAHAAGEHSHGEETHTHDGDDDPEHGDGGHAH